MKTIPAGIFQIGDSNDFASDAPVRMMNVPSFQIEENLVTFVLWKGVVAAATGYAFSKGAGQSFPGYNQPVHTVNWFDAVKFCNARSEQEKLVPCYYLSDGKTYRSGEVSPSCDWSASGYRLPTEAEWEKAARGGLVGQRFPWGMTITHRQAVYVTPAAGASYDVGQKNIAPNSTSPVASFPANGYGLYDMAGNLNEWCGDWYGNPPVGLHGPAVGTKRVVRGGSWQDSAGMCRVSARGAGRPSGKSNTGGFRCAQTGVPK